MLKKSFFHKLISVLLCLTLLLTACGKTDIEDTPSIKPMQVTDVPEIPDDAYLAISGDAGFAVTHNTLDMDEFRFMHTNFVVSGDFLYIVSGNRLRRINLYDSSHITSEISDFEPDMYFPNIAKNSQGNILLLQNVYTQDSGIKYHLYEVSADFTDGQSLSAIYITDINAILSLKEDCFIQGIYNDLNDNLYFRIFNMHDGYTLVALDKERKLLGRINSRNFIVEVFSTNDGMVYFTETSNEGSKIYPVEIASGTIGPAVALDGIWTSTTFFRLATAGTTDFLYSAGQNLWEHDPGTGTNTMILSWMDLGFDSNTLGGFGRLTDGSIWLLDEIQTSRGPWLYIDYELITMSPAAFDPNIERINITYGMMDGGYRGDIEKAMMEFNRINPFVRVSFKLYNDFQSFTNDIILTGEPDILNLGSFNYNTLANKGFLVDLNPYIENAGINRADYLPNVLNQFEKDGKLYGISYNFSIDGFVGRSDILLENESFTIEELISFAEKHPEAKLWNANADFTLQMLVGESLDEFIDWDSGECYFESDKFIMVLEFAKTFGNDPNHNWFDTDAGFNEGRYLLKRFYIQSLHAFQFNHISAEGADLKYIGYPSKDKNGVLIRSFVHSVAINSKSENKDAAFAFINFLLSDRYQTDHRNNSNFVSLPVKLSAIEAMIEKETTPIMYYNWETDREEEWPGDVVWFQGSNDPVKSFNSRNHLFIDTFKDLLARADTLAYFDREIYIIINEESAAFFAGQKTARDVAKIIQNRVWIYVNENR